MTEKKAVFIRVDLKNEIKALAAKQNMTIQAVVEAALSSLLDENQKNNVQGT